MVVTFRKIISWLKAKCQGEYLMAGLMVAWIAQATASRVRCKSWNQSIPENCMVRSISPMVRCTRSMTPLLLGLRTEVDFALIP